MFKTAVDISMLSPIATVRWKRESLIETERKTSKADHKRVHSLISTSNASKFLNLSLQPSNSTKASKHKDLKEISLELSILRKKHDLNCNSNIHHDSDIVRLKRRLGTFNLEETKTINKISSLKSQVDKLEQSVEEVKKNQEDALSATSVYKHILERMKHSRLQLDIKNQSIIKALKSNKKILEGELDTFRRHKESKIKTKQALGALEVYIEEETREKHEDLDAITKDAKQKQENNHKREERFRRQLEIAEAAANEDRDMRVTQIREGLMAHRFWYLYLVKKMEKDIEKFSSTEKAFQKVRKIAGVNDASEMVTKFLTAELAFNDLKKNVYDVNNRIEDTQEKISVIEQKIISTEKLKMQTNNIENLKIDIIEKLQMISNDKKKLMKLAEVYEKSRIWAERNLKKFEKTETYKDLPEYIRAIKREVTGFLDKIKGNGSFIKSFNETQDKVLKFRIKDIVDNIDDQELIKLKPDAEDDDYSQVIRDLADSKCTVENKQKKISFN